MKTSKEKSDFGELLGATNKKNKPTTSKSEVTSESDSRMDVTESEGEMFAAASPVKTPSKRKSESEPVGGERKKTKVCTVHC